MNAVQKRFGRTRILLPVLHCVDAEQVSRAVDVAMGGGADGIMLISHGEVTNAEVLRLAVDAAADGVPFVGVNLLGARPEHAVDSIGVHGEVGGLWVDDAWGSLGSPMGDAMARAVAANLRVLDRLYFGGVAFKYQRKVPQGQLGAVAQLAADLGVSVVTTSGPATGSPPSVDKVAAMCAALGDHALAVASGISPGNVELFLPHVDAFLVATGLEEGYGVFDAGRVRALADAVHSYALPASTPGKEPR